MYEHTYQRNGRLLACNVRQDRLAGRNLHLGRGTWLDVFGFVHAVQDCYRKKEDEKDNYTRNALHSASLEHCSGL